MTVSRTTDLWKSLVSLRQLDQAWEKVRSNNGSAGGDGLSIDAFQAGAAQRLAKIASALDAETWRPLPYRMVDIPKAKGGTRRLTIPSVADRVVHTSLAMVLTPVLDPMFEDGSYAYRPGRSVQQAVREIGRLRDAGYWHVIEADIVGFFDAVAHDILLNKLEAALEGWPGGARVVDLIALVLEHQAQETGRMGRGVAQGSALSPLMANLYLDDLDSRIHGKGVRIIRFADDFVVLCKKRESAEAALQEVEVLMAELGLELHAGGTRVLDFDRGFDFLGQLFVRSLTFAQVADPEENTVDLLRMVNEQDAQLAAELQTERKAGYDRGGRVLYLMEPGRRLSLANQSFAVTTGGERKLAAISHGRVGRIELGPGTVADSDVVEHALATGTELAFVNGSGETLGMLTGQPGARAGLHLAQAKAFLDPVISAAFARALADARIRNQRNQLYRLNRTRADGEVIAALARMQRHLRKLHLLDRTDEIRGIEGVCAAEYWPALGRMTQGAPCPLRRQRPALDGMNAALNYLASILARDTRAAVLAAGLHPGFGLLHKPRDRAEGCVYDMMEPFRAPLVEGQVAFLFNARRLRKDMFTRTEKGVHISREGRRALIVGYEAAVDKQVKSPSTGKKYAWRAIMRMQAQSLAKAMRADDPALFHPYIMKA